MSTSTSGDKRVVAIVVVVSLVTLLYSLLVAHKPLSGLVGVALLVGSYLLWRFVSSG